MFLVHDFWLVFKIYNEIIASTERYWFYSLIVDYTLYVYEVRPLIKTKYYLLAIYWFTDHVIVDPLLLVIDKPYILLRTCLA